MATNSKVFVSPGVYTSEVDLSFVAQSVGVTTLGIVGETLKGPAFEPIFIRNFDEFTNFFGGTSPEKFINTQIPKYEASYIAKSYLQQSNQLFVTRILGLSGYDAGPSWSFRTIANVDKSTVTFDCSGTTYDLNLCADVCTGYTEYSYTIPFTGCNNDITSVVFGTISGDNSIITNKFNQSYEEFNGSTSTIISNFQQQIFDVIVSSSTLPNSATSIYYYGTILGSDYDSLSLTYTNETNVFEVNNVDSLLADYTAPENDPWYYALFDNNSGDYSGSSYYSIINNIAQSSSSSNCASFYSLSVSSATVSNTVGSINYNTNTIDVVLPFTTPTSGLTALTVMFSACTTDVKVGGVTQESTGTTQNFSAGTKSYVLVSQDSGTTNTWTVNVTIDNPCNPATSGNTGTNNTGAITTCYTGSVSGVIYVYTGTSYTDFDDLVIGTLRSRGIATYGTGSDGPVYQVSGLTDVTMNCTGNYSTISKNPYSTFGLNVTDYEGNTFFFETSFSESDSKYLPKVFGSSNFAKPRTTVPLFVEERFQTLLNYGYNKGYIRGLNCDLLALPRANNQNNDMSSIAFYLEKYQTPVSPWVVSEVRGSKVYDLFRFTTISDGNLANTEVKISIVNMSFGNLTFDILVRDFFDTDNNPVVIEKFTNCSMNPADNAFVAKKIGTADGEYELNSKYIMVEMNEDAPADSLPCGFKGFNFRNYSTSRSPFPIYKTKYDYPGEVVFDPPFGLSSGSNSTIQSPGDNVRRTYLGISTGYGAGYDSDFFQYKGKQLPLNLCTATEGADWTYKTRGFHMDINAASIVYPGTSNPEFYVGDTTFTSDPTSEASPYYRIYSRKFTLLVQGGFDGWDIYRESRSNTDTFKLGRRGFLNGYCPDIKYPTATGWGAFKQITVGNNSVDWGNSDYYAYLLGQQTFSNPEAVNINLFVTPGIDYVNNSDLVEEAIEMVEFNRADSLYICTTPDIDLFTPTVDLSSDLIYLQEAVNNLEETGIDSNYTATYYPWVLTRDSVNNTQIYLPPTAEVTRNLALTDNIAFPWFAAAGYTRGIVNAVKARKKLTQEDRDTLYQGRLNPIATFSDVGTVIWGNKTLQVAQSALDRINVRRLLLQARKLISAVSVRLLFEQNDQKVRQDFLDSVNPILDAIRRDRGLYDFRVTVSSDAADLDRNQMTGKIYIKPTKSLEFIDITFYITPTGASFDNI
jgi:hypothetical protein